MPKENTSPPHRRTTTYKLTYLMGCIYASRWKTIETDRSKEDLLNVISTTLSIANEVADMKSLKLVFSMIILPSCLHMVNDDGMITCVSPKKASRDTLALVGISTNLLKLTTTTFGIFCYNENEKVWINNS